MGERSIYIDDYGGGYDYYTTISPVSPLARLRRRARAPVPSDGGEIQNENMAPIYPFAFATAALAPVAAKRRNNLEQRGRKRYGTKLKAFLHSAIDLLLTQLSFVIPSAAPRRLSFLHTVASCDSEADSFQPTLLDRLRSSGKSRLEDQGGREEKEVGKKW